MKPYYDDGENLPEEDLPPDWAQPMEMDAPPVAPPLEQITDPNHVPPELRWDYKTPAPLPDDRLKEASAKDRTRQDQADLRAYLLAAGRREAPQLRNLGSPETAAVQAQMAHEPKPEDPMSRELMALNVMKARQSLQPKPVDPYAEQLKKLQLALGNKRLNESPKAEGKPPLDANARAFWESKVGPLPPTATADDVQKLISLTNMEHMGMTKKEIADLSRALSDSHFRETQADQDFNKGNRDLPASTVIDLADADVAIGSVTKLGDDFAADKVGGSWYDRPAAAVSKGLNLNNDYTHFMDKALVAMQGVGKIMEGGKLAAGDETKFRSMLPQPGDSNERAKSKAAEAAAFLKSLKDKREAQLRASGFRVGGQSNPPVDRKAKPAPRYKQLPNGDLEEIE